MCPFSIMNYTFQVTSKISALCSPRNGWVGMECKSWKWAAPLGCGWSFIFIFLWSFPIGASLSWSPRDRIWFLGHQQHNHVPCLFLWSGLSSSKPTVISLLEQGKEPWMVDRELTRGLCSGKWEVIEQEQNLRRYYLYKMLSENSPQKPKPSSIKEVSCFFSLILYSQSNVAGTFLCHF